MLTPTRRNRVQAVAIGLLVAVSPGVAFAAEGLNLIPDFLLAIGLMAGFILLVYPLNAILFKPIFAVLDERDKRIAGARRRAEKLQRDADAVTARYREAVRDVRLEAEQARRARLDEARSEQAAITGRARSEAEGQLGQARAELRSAVEEARSSLRGEVEELARQAAERIVGRELN